jgi:hypothetical protein
MKPIALDTESRKKLKQLTYQVCRLADTYCYYEDFSYFMNDFATICWQYNIDARRIYFSRRGRYKKKPEVIEPIQVVEEYLKKSLKIKKLSKEEVFIWKCCFVLDMHTWVDDTHEMYGRLGYILHHFGFDLYKIFWPERFRTIQQEHIKNSYKSLFNRRLVLRKRDLNNEED